MTEQGVRIAAASPAGLFYGVADAAATASAGHRAGGAGAGEWKVAAGVIRDYPRFAWRGAMLDVARHFFSVEDVKRFIDLIASYKLNVLQLHLSGRPGMAHRDRVVAAGSRRWAG